VSREKISGIYVETDGLSGHKTKVWYIASDGTTTELEGCITDVEITIGMRELNTVKLTALCKGAKVLGTLGKIDFKDISK